MMIYLKLVYEFFKIGLFAVGGGAATIPFLSSLSEKTAWFTKTDLANMIAISESTPGPIGVNMSTYAGYITGAIEGSVVLGALIASLGLVAPSIIISVIISGVLKRFKENKVVKDVFYGLRPASVGLIAAAAFEVAKVSLINIGLFLDTSAVFDLFRLKEIILFVILFFAMKRFKLHPVIYVLISAAIGIVFKF